jgi:hypothetical protein
MLPNEAETTAAIRAKFATVVERMERALAATTQMLTGGALTITATVEINRQTVIVLVWLLAKMCKTFRAFQLVCLRGLGEDAGVLLRVLFEHALCARWVLNSEPTLRAQYVLAHAAYRSLVMARGVHAASGDHRFEEPLAQLQKHADEWSQTLGPEVFEQIKRSWCPGGIQAAAREIGWILQYAVIYRETSSFAHASDIASHVFLPPDGGLVVHLRPSDEKVRQFSDFAMLFLLGAASDVNEGLGLGHDESLRSLLQTLSAQVNESKE